MEMDCNFKKKWPIFFKFFLCILEKLLETDSSLFFFSYFSPGVLRTISCERRGSLSNI